MFCNFFTFWLFFFSQHFFNFFCFFFFPRKSLKSTHSLDFLGRKKKKQQRKKKKTQFSLTQSIFAQKVQILNYSGEIKKYGTFESVGPILTAPCCRECSGFFFCWLKSYNSVVFPWKSLLFSATFHGTQLPWVPWIFWLKLLNSQVDQFSRHLAAVSAWFFFLIKIL